VALGNQLASAILGDLVELTVANELDELVEVGQKPHRGADSGERDRAGMVCEIFIT
jgi:hypothetical protein